MYYILKEWRIIKRFAVTTQKMMFKESRCKEKKGWFLIIQFPVRQVSRSYTLFSIERYAALSRF
jgi:hypothetical protein